MKHLVVVESERDPDLHIVMDFAEAYRVGLLSVWPKSPIYGEANRIFSDAPSITLNIQGTIISRKELWFWALVGLLLQTFTLVFPAIATYHWKWLRKGIHVSDYAYGCFLAGNIAVIIGLLGCGHIIVGSTTEYTFRPSQEYGHRPAPREYRIQQILRLQIDCVLSSQHFPSFAILNPPGNNLICTSHLNSKNYR